MTRETRTDRAPELGLVCITSSDAVRYKTITRTRLLRLDREEQEATLEALYRANLTRLERAVAFCRERGIGLYRLTSDFMPFSDVAAGEAALERVAAEARRVGGLVTESGIRMVLHPDQFVVLNSDEPRVISNSVSILEAHARIFDLLGQPRSAWAAFNIHGGKGGRADRLVEQIGRLPDAVRSRVTFENDERAYGSADMLDVCRRAGVPMVFDAHHHVVKEGLDSYDHPSVGEALAAARETWEPRPDWQLVHISNGREAFGDRRHSDLITAMPESFRHAPWIEVEAKSKELAIERLREFWPGRRPKSAA